MNQCLAQRAVEERVALARKLHRRAVEAGHRFLAETWQSKLREYEEEMRVIRESIQRMEAIAARQQLQAAQ